MFPQIGVATTVLFERLGLDFSVPERQTCCGQMHINSGYASMARGLIQNQARAFADYDIVVAPSASCVSSIRHQYASIAEDSGDPNLLAAVKDLASRTYELSEFLVDILGVTDVGAYFPHRVTYHPTCHSLRSLRVEDRPRRLLVAVEGLELIDLPLAESCCGFGGTFALKNEDVSGAMLEDKANCVRETGASHLTAVDGSCLMQIGGGLSRASIPVQPLHLVEILASTR
jgi:L-lactate dehydrogenase complex protein LldE